MNQRYLTYGGIILGIIITVFGGMWLVSPSANVDEEPLGEDDLLFEEGEPVEEEVETEPGDEEATEDVFVDVKGEVIDPGIYALDPDRRIDDAIHEAGGLTEEANQNGVNFAKKLEDEMVVYVPHEDEEDQDIWEEGTENAGSEESGENVNINAADEAALQQLSGVGPVTAEAIVQYREENGNFEQPGDIQNVSGIGEKTFEKLEDSIEVN
ncbi:helix-hairpin-helix domain-containing protein [Natribacillus halophilus]|uniref:Competence protein ComEA n=1 Tax=Natribacillus halophilus TaxID=549003 RepID=A0A1G8JU26_9BACI|nr:helix-hairpin-helix domain-containing protein [Natribacillus halophilus]SDI34688.1 competence protein ComEA [Natribacillus halophilus]